MDIFSENCALTLISKDLVSKYFKESIIKVDEQTVPGYPAPWVAFRLSTMR